MIRLRIQFSAEDAFYHQRCYAGGSKCFVQLQKIMAFSGLEHDLLAAVFANLCEEFCAT